MLVKKKLIYDKQYPHQHNTRNLTKTKRWCIHLKTKEKKVYVKKVYVANKLHKCILSFRFDEPVITRNKGNRFHHSVGCREKVITNEIRYNLVIHTF